MTEQGTNDAERTVRLRKPVKRKKPKFVRPESWRYTRLKENWRRPRGLDHKMRIKYKGWPPAVSAGYRGPRAIRGLHPSGYKEVLVYNAEEVGKIDPQIQAIRIAHTVGKRKRAKILSEAKKKGIAILNVKETKKMIGKEEKLAEEESEEEKESEGIEKPEQGQDKTKKLKEKVEEQ